MYIQICVTITTVNSRTFSSPEEEMWHPLTVSSLVSTCCRSKQALISFPFFFFLKISEALMNQHFAINLHHFLISSSPNFDTCSPLQLEPGHWGTQWSKSSATEQLRVRVKTQSVLRWTENLDPAFGASPQPEVFPWRSHCRIPLLASCEVQKHVVD